MKHASASCGVVYCKSLGVPAGQPGPPHKRRLRSEHDSKGNLATVRLHTTITVMNPP